jgi:hypothetical protein
MGEGGPDRLGVPHQEQRAMPSRLILSLRSHTNPSLASAPYIYTEVKNEAKMLV